MLQHKFSIFKNLIVGAIEHPDEGTRITIEQARRITSYTHESFFRHLRLYDYVLKNTKLSEVKRVNIPTAEPNWGQSLSVAMALGDGISVNESISSDKNKDMLAKVMN